MVHEHPFIKITRPEQAPAVIVTALNENQPEEEVKDPDEGCHRRGGRGGRGGRGRAFRQMAHQMVEMVTREVMGTAR